MGNPTILIVEDDAAALLLTKRVLKKALLDQGVAIEIAVAMDGEAALEQVEEAYQKDNLPLLMLLDWALPKKHGSEVLEAIRQNPNTQHIPVVIVTSSNAEPDRTQAFDLGANDFVHKSLAYKDFEQALSQTCRHYLNLL